MPLYLNKNFTIATWLTSLAAVILLAISFLLGNNKFFLLLNCNGGVFMDIFFTYFTKLAEVIPWLFATAWVVIFKRNFFTFLLSIFLISTALSQGIKNILPEQARPTKAITNIAEIHTVEGVELHTVFSFPSGHTTTAFSIFLFFVLLVNKKWVLVIGFLYASTIAYSRIYLAQHFPKDLGGGMLCAVLAVYVSIYIFKNLPIRSKIES